jgi:hypothetical protein
MSTAEKAATAVKTAPVGTTAKITVIEAVYGAVQGTKDVTGIVQKLVDQGRTSFYANNDTLGPDPAKGHDKHFAMSYLVGASGFSFACKENQEVSLRTEELPRGPITVIAAAYGAIDKQDPTLGARDVTHIVQRLLDEDGSTEVKFTPSNQLFGDPSPGPRKNFGMTYVPTKEPARRMVVASDENQQVTVKLI